MQENIIPQPETKLTSPLNLINVLIHAPVAMGIYRGPHHIIELANKAMCSFWDKTAEEVTERPLFDILPEAEEQGLKTIFDNVYRTGEKYVINEIPIELIVKGNKQKRYYNLLLEALRDNYGNVNGIMGLAQDVNDHVMARKSIEESERKYRALIEDTNIATAIYEGRDMIITYANDAKIKIWGKGNDVIGKKLVEVLPEVLNQPFVNILKRVYETGEEYQAVEDEAQLMIDGQLQTIYANFVYKPLKDENGKTYAILNSTVDVTPLVNARKKTEELEEKKRLALEAGKYGIWDFDLTNGIMELDDRCMELFNIPKTKKIEPEELYNYIDEKDHDKVTEAVMNCLDPKIKSDYNTEIRIKLDSGLVRWIRSKGRAYFRDDVAYRFVGTAQDITPERTIRDEQQKLLKLVDNSIELMSLLKLDNKNSYINKAGMDLLGFDSFEQMLETPITDLHEPEDYKKVSDEVLHSLKETGRWSGQMKVKHLKTGEIIPVSNNTIRIDDPETGEILAFGAVMRDMRPELQAQKNLKDSELLFKQYVNGLPVGFYTVDTAGTITLFNEAAASIWGKRPVIGRDKYNGAMELLKADGSPMTDAELPMKKALEAKVAHKEEAIVIRPDGEKRYIIAYPQPMFNSEGTFTGAMNILVDITDRKLAENALNISEGNYKKLNSELEQRIDHRTHDLKSANLNLKRSNADLQQFAYVASHDLQEPLRKIQIFSDMILNNTDDPEFLKKQVMKIDAASKRMSTLVKDLLGFSRLSSLDYAFEVVDLNKIIASVTGDMELLIAEKGAIILTEKLPLISGIPLQLYQLFLNLVSNAIKFSERTPEIKISADIADAHLLYNDDNISKEHKCLHIRFSDNGIGFDNTMSSKIFTIFQRLNPNEKYSGTGIGLAICKKVMENHHGQITAESTAGVGTTFHMYFPLD